MRKCAHILSSDRCKTYWTGFTLWPQEHPLGWDLGGGAGSKIKFLTTWSCGISNWREWWVEEHTSRILPGCLKLCCLVQGQFLPEAWGFAMACHRLPDVVFNYSYYLIHCSLETPKWVIGKQCRPRSDATEWGIWSGSPLFANSSTIFLKG